MKRIITSIRNANKDVLRAISLEYPKGVEDSDLVSLPTSTGANIRALEIELSDAFYLIKMDDEAFYRQFLAKEDSTETEDESLVTEEVELPDEEAN